MEEKSKFYPGESLTDGCDAGVIQMSFKHEHVTFSQGRALQHRAPLAQSTGQLRCQSSTLCDIVLDNSAPFSLFLSSMRTAALAPTFARRHLQQACLVMFLRGTLKASLPDHKRFVPIRVLRIPSGSISMVTTFLDERTS